MKQHVKRLIGERRKKLWLFRRARICEQVGVRRYSWPGWNGLDRRLVEHLGFRQGGVFIEAGANDGYAQSNTYYLERHLGWTGLLIEPVPELAELCRRFRPNADVRQVALCSRSDDGSRLALSVHDLTTSVSGWPGNAPDATETTILVPCRTLSSVVEASGLTQIDLLSLDVEGYELSVLDGLDERMPVPRHVLVETSRPREVERLLASTHVPRAQLSHHDYLFEATGATTLPTPRAQARSSP